MSDTTVVKEVRAKCKRVSDVDFVTAYQNCATRQEVADITGLQIASVSVRSTELRKRGVDLKKFTRVGNRGQRTDVSGLNNLISEMSSS